MSITLCNKYFNSDLIHLSGEFSAKAKNALTSISDKTCLGSEYTGWFHWPEQQGFALVDQIQNQLQHLDTSYNLIVVIGIGGSYLGTRAVADALSPTYMQLKSPYKPIVYLGHDLAESSFQDVLALLDQYDPIINVISKSGTTTEPSIAFRFIRQYLAKRYQKDEIKKRLIITTDANKGALRSMTDKEGYTSFVVPDDVGGRYSVLTAVGLVPLALAGFDIKSMMQGAHQEFLDISQNENHAVFNYATYRFAAYKQGKTVEVLAFSEPKLRQLTSWWQQLFGESEGKQHKGILPMSLCYSTDLHSMGQFIQDGTRNMFETFLKVEDSESNTLRVPSEPSNYDGFEYVANKKLSFINDAAMLGTKQAHFDGGVPCLEIKISKLDAEHLGRLFAFFETSCAISCQLFEVNAFDQPGVEAYKTNLFKLLKTP